MNCDTRSRMPRAVSWAVVTDGTAVLPAATTVVRSDAASARAVDAASSVRPGTDGTTTTASPRTSSSASRAGVEAGRSFARRPASNVNRSSPAAARASTSERSAGGCSVVAVDPTTMVRARPVTRSIRAATARASDDVIRGSSNLPGTRNAAGSDARREASASPSIARPVRAARTVMPSPPTITSASRAGTGGPSLRASVATAARSTAHDRATSRPSPRPTALRRTPKRFTPAASTASTTRARAPRAVPVVRTFRRGPKTSTGPAATVCACLATARSASAGDIPPTATPSTRAPSGSRAPTSVSASRRTPATSATPIPAATATATRRRRRSAAPTTGYPDAVTGTPSIRR